MSDTPAVEKGAVRSAYEKASFFSRLLFLWLEPLIYKAFRRGINDQDFTLNQEEEAERTYAVFSKYWAEEQKRPDKKPSLIRAILRAFGRDMFLAMLAKLTWGALVILAAYYFIQALLKHVQATNDYHSNPVKFPYLPPAWEGYLYALFFFIDCFVLSVALQQMTSLANLVGIRIRASVMTAIYRKSLKLEGIAHRVGDVVTLVSNDCSRLAEGAVAVHYLYSGPLESLAIVLIVFAQTGLSAFYALGLILIVVPIQYIIALAIARVRRTHIHTTDRRIRIINEIFQSMKLVKFYAWEKSFANAIAEIRLKELVLLRKTAVLKTTHLAVVFIIPLLLVLGVFALFTMTMGMKLTASISFTVLSLFNTLRFPLVVLPVALKNFSDMLSALNRINSFLLLPEVDQPVHEEEPEITFVNAVIGYPHIQASAVNEAHNVAASSEKLAQSRENVVLTEKPEFKLENVHFSIKKRGIVGIVGSVASGKSTIINAILDEAKIISGSMRVGGKMAYVPQTSWIQQESVRENILFGRPFDAEKYRRVIFACALERDMEILEHGDMTVIGEGGINLSGGQRQRISLARAAYSEAEVYLLDSPLSAVDHFNCNHIFKHLILDMLRDKLVVLVTHNLHLLPAMDTVVIVKEGRATYNGPYSLDAIKKYFSPAAAELITEAHHEVEELRAELKEEDDDGRAKEESGITTTTAASSDASDESAGSSGPSGIEIEVAVPEKIDAALAGAAVSIQEEPTLTKAEEAPAVAETDIVVPPAEAPKATVSFADAPEIAGAADATSTADVANKESLHFPAKTEPDAEEANAAKEPLPSAHNKPNSRHASSKHRMNKAKIPIDPNEVHILRTRASSVASTRRLPPTAVGMNTYLEWMRQGTRIGFLIAFLVLAGAQVARILSDLYVKTWSQAWKGLADGVQPSYEKLRELAVTYTIYTAIFLFLLFARGVTFFFVTLRASTRLHNKALKKTLRAPISFFTVTPLGNLLNAFSKQQDVVDEHLPDAMHMSLIYFMILGTTVGLITATVYYYSVVIFFLLVVFFFMQTYQSKIADFLKMRTIETNAPIYAQVSESLHGILVLRAYRAEERFRQMSMALIDANHRLVFNMTSLQCWSSVRLDFVASMMVFAACLFCVAERDTLTASDAGLVVSQAFQMLVFLTLLVRGITDVKSHISAVHSILQYARIPSAERQRGDSVLSTPLRGKIEFRDVCLSYFPDSPNVLEQVSFVIEAGTKVGIVGRTGSGKSTLLMALFRLVETKPGGTILIDDVDIANCKLDQVRSSMSIIPQEPVMFQGTIRSNMDPFNSYDDAALWKALELSHLRPMVESIPGGLDGVVEEGGSNFSLGQKQLFCLARAVLKDSNILVLDEATSALDIETDALIQKTIRSVFAKRTVLTIAHRLGTIMDYDKILFMDHGHLLEYDYTKNLLANPNSHFNKLIQG